MPILLEGLRESQVDHQLDDKRFAKFLKIHPTALSRLKSGQRPFSLYHLHCIMLALPGLEGLVIYYLRSEYHRNH